MEASALREGLKRLEEKQAKTEQSVMAALAEWKEARRAAVEEGATPDRFARLAKAEAGLLKVAP